MLHSEEPHFKAYIWKQPICAAAWTYCLFSSGGHAYPRSCLYVSETPADFHSENV